MSLKKEMGPRFAQNIQIFCLVSKLLKNKKIHKATEELAKKIQNENYIHTLRGQKESEVWIYRNGIYVPHGKTYIKEMVRSYLWTIYSPQIANLTISKIEADTYTINEEFFKEEPPHLICVENGILDLKAKKLLPFTPKKRFLSKLPVKFNPNADCPKIKKHFHTVLINEDDILAIEELIGSCLYRDYLFEKAFMLLGNGRNGKGKTLEIIKRFLGTHNCTNVSLKRLEEKEFALILLFQKLANLCDDLDKGALSGSGMFKQCTGHGMLVADRKYLGHVSFVNYAKFVYCANELPRPNDYSFAFFDRWSIIEFPFKFISKEEYEMATSLERKKLKIAKRGHIDEITTPDELSGLLNLAVEGLHRLMQQKHFTGSKNAEETKLRWLRETNSIYGFLCEAIEVNHNDFITKEDFRSYYQDYCEKNALGSCSDVEIKQTLKDLFNIKDCQKTVNGQRKYVWLGISFKNSFIFNFDEYDMSNVNKED
jgi:P4 family phage/plasmid primase-like protien